MIRRLYLRIYLTTLGALASVVAFLCSTQASLVNGANITVDGGQSRSF